MSSGLCRSTVGWLLVLGLAGAMAGVACSAETPLPPAPVFTHPSQGGAGGEGGAPPTSTSCTKVATGCLCPKAGDTAECKVVETFDDYTTCTIGFYTCGDNGKWGPCVGDRTTTPASALPGESSARGN